MKTNYRSNRYIESTKQTKKQNRQRMIVQEDQKDQDQTHGQCCGGSRGHDTYNRRLSTTTVLTQVSEQSGSNKTTTKHSSSSSFGVTSTHPNNYGFKNNQGNHVDSNNDQGRVPTPTGGTSRRNNPEPPTPALLSTPDLMMRMMKQQQDDEQYGGMSPMIQNNGEHYTMSPLLRRLSPIKNGTKGLLDYVGTASSSTTTSLADESFQYAISVFNKLHGQFDTNNSTTLSDTLKKQLAFEKVIIEPK